jgi:hypothetical protein
MGVLIEKNKIFAFGIVVMYAKYTDLNFALGGPAMSNNTWVYDLIHQKLSSIVFELNRNNINEVTDLLVKSLERSHLTLVPTYLSDEMYDAQCKIDNDLSYESAQAIYSAALKDYAYRKEHSPIKEIIDAYR